MCDFIRTENIKLVIEHIVTKHLSQQPASSPKAEDTSMKRTPSLEDVATPYVDTLTLLRHKYEANKTLSVIKIGSNENSNGNVFDNDESRLMQNEKAREDQVRFFYYSSFIGLLFQIASLMILFSLIAQIS